MIENQLNGPDDEMRWSKRILHATVQTGCIFLTMIPVMLGFLLLTSLIIPLVPVVLEFSKSGNHPLIDALAGAGVGSIALGQPVVSYLLGGELLNRGVSLIGVTAMVVAWVTVGIIQLPVEAVMLGWRFAIARNLLNFLFAVIIAFIITGMVNAFK